MDLKSAPALSSPGKTAALDAAPERAGLGLSWVTGFYFAFRPSLVVLAVRVFGQDPQAGAALSLALNFLLLGAAAFLLPGVRSEAGGRSRRAESTIWVLTFLGFSGASLLWTEAASPPAAIAFWCALAADVAIVLLLLRSNEASRIACELIGGFVLGACCLAALGWMLPAQSDLRLGDEELLGPNSFGYICALAILLDQLASRWRGGKRGWGVAPAFLALTLLRTLSKTTLAAFLAAEAFLLMSDRSMSRKTKWLLLLGTALAVAGAWSFLQSYFDIYTSAGNQAETLSGRIGIWAYFLERALEQPWIGHGFHSVWKIIPPFGPDQFEARHAHNEWLQQFYTYGACGVAITAALYGSFFRQIRKLYPSPQRTLLFALLIFVLVRGTAESEPFDLLLPLWAMVLLSATIGELQRNAASTIADFSGE
jgi:exopolysaccharide production protein ExoQ